MPKTLPPDNAHLQEAVQRLKRSHWLWAGILIGLGALTQLSPWLTYPVAGLPLIILGGACLLLRDPALLAAVGVVLLLSTPAYFHRNLVVLGPDPLPEMIVKYTGDGSALQFAAFAVVFALGKLMLAYMAFNQFWLMRFLYGTERATNTEAKQAVIPALVPNRLTQQLSWAFGLALASAVSIVVFIIIAVSGAPLWPTHLAASVAGNLGALALALAVGVIFSPTDLRGAALFSGGLGALSYIIAMIGLLFLPMLPN